MKESFSSIISFHEFFVGSGAGTVGRRRVGASGSHPSANECVMSYSTRNNGWYNYRVSQGTRFNA
jgi:hypothetical protein